MSRHSNVATPTFKLGEAVQWTSAAGGHSKTKKGPIAQVVPAGALPDRDRFLPLYKMSGVSSVRDHESYVVLVGTKPYWPRVKALSAAPSADASATT